MIRRLDLPDSGVPAEGAIRHAPSAARNLEPIAAVLARHLPQTGRVLELASGTGQHIVAFALRFPGLDWQPSDLDPDNLGSIAARAEQDGAANLRAPIRLDACAPGWGGDAAWDAICLTNLLHLISTPEAEVLLAEAARALAPGGVFALYGPFRQDGQLVSEGDRAFDASLRGQDPAIGYKDIEWVEARLASGGLSRRDRIAMPANNLMLISERPVDAAAARLGGAG
jgi:SAM-dependent methyltransferase